MLVDVVGLGGWWWSEVKVECAPAVQQERTPAASAWLSVCLLESYFLEDCCWVVLVSGKVMVGVVEWLWQGLWPIPTLGLR